MLNRMFYLEVTFINVADTLNQLIKPPLGRLVFRRLVCCHITFHRLTGANKVPVAEGVVDAAN